jgi:SAM-dependent methyltransferase
MRLVYSPTMTDATDAHLAAQYEAYPYPERDPRDERKRLIVGSPSHLREVDFWVFGARRPADLPLNALVAGGGTGDGTIMLATHLARAGRPGTVTYLDRAEARGLTNIDFRQGSLLDLPRLGLGPFDYIDCCGVLHHLPEPDAGLAALLSVLAPGGGMGLMVYAPHGRTGVYMLQDALRLLAPETEPPAARLDVARRVMRHLPDSAWLRANRNFADHITGGDAGLYDLLLNPRDRAYDVPSLAALLGRAGLAITCLVEPLRYDPASYLPDPKLRALAAAMDPIARAALAEAMAGNISTHVVYCVRAADRPAPPDGLDEAAVPVAREMPGADLAQAIHPDGTLPFLFDGLRVKVPMPKLGAALLRAIDGTRTVAQIIDTVCANGADPAMARRAWREVWEGMSSMNRVLLVPPA